MPDTEIGSTGRGFSFQNSLKERGHIYKGVYEGWYSTTEEAFVTDVKEIEVNGKKVTVEAETEKQVEWIKEDNYLFPLSKFKGSQWENYSART